MSEENKTAEETTILDLAIQEIEKQKFNLNVHKLPATKVGLTDALNVLEYLKEEHYIKCECGHIVEHKFSHTNEDGQVTCSLCVIAQQQEINAEQLRLSKIELSSLAERSNKEMAELKKQLKASEKRLDKYSDYLSLTLDGVEPERAKKDCKL